MSFHVTFMEMATAMTGWDDPEMGRQYALF